MRLTIAVDDADPASLAGLVAALECKPPIRAAPATEVGRLTAKADAQHAAARLRQVLKSLDVPGLNGV